MWPEDRIEMHKSQRLDRRDTKVVGNRCWMERKRSEPRTHSCVKWEFGLKVKVGGCQPNALIIADITARMPS